MERVLIVGGSGMVGTQLQKMFLDCGYVVAVLGRSSSNISNVKTYLWNVESKTIDEAAITTADYIINLAGAGIVDTRWTAKRKEQLIDSRVDSTQFLLQTIIKTNAKPKVFVAASAIGYYGNSTTERQFVEEDLPSNDFLGNCCKLWEEASQKVMEMGVKRVVLRIGVVLAHNGGMLEKVKPLFNWGLGSAIGNGKQAISWIHIDDLCACFIKAIEQMKDFQ